MSNFGSDNVTGAHPKVMEALSAAAAGSATPYGGDDWTARVQDRLREVFEKPDLLAFPVATGTAANALALATVVPPYGSVLCHADAHVHVDECGAPEMFTGGAKLVPLAGTDGKLTPQTIQAAIDHAGVRDVHRVQPAAVTITQATEAGTVYSVAEVAAIAECCRRNGLPLHMDGARFGNAVAALDVPPAEVTWKAGVDMLSFGATKNGCWAAEAVVFFDPALARDFVYRRKRAGHLFSKMRFVSAQLEAYLADDLWLANARHANACARRLAEGLSAACVDLAHPVQANEIFAHLPPATQARVKDAGFVVIPWPDLGTDAVRMVCAWNTDMADVERLIAVVAGRAA
ncbi:threonine aldolase family protein [Caenispirillum bisanense]|uniref:L-threonine aldolase n=1 Tax=Caenispirillum bisanense TaxID=414052 RepID=A0A286GA33_9PROT|nr:low specificity L-threonine aldolase [Caenispirillum bisanense]SOD92312.1 L-threonine aldolase [Caenispirillum bisanense]